MDTDRSTINSDNNGEEKEHRIRRFLLGWLIALNKGITRLLKSAVGVNYMMVTEEEVMGMVEALAKNHDEGGDEGSIEESSARMINNIFEFDDLTAADVMTHRTNIVGVDKSVSLDDLIYLALDLGFSRIPVYNETIDKIIGLVIVKDLLCLIGKDKGALENFNVTEFLRDVIFIPEACPCSSTFKSLTSLKSGMAVVVDEYGGTAGIVTLEDIIEAVMGNIQDEYDDEQSYIVKVGEGQYEVDGEADPDEVFGLYSISLPEAHEYETIAGFVTGMLGYIPEGNEPDPPSVEYGGIKLVVMRVEDRCIKKIRTFPPKKEEEKEQPQEKNSRFK